MGRVRLEWRGGSYEEFLTLDDAKNMVFAVFPNVIPRPWKTTDDGNHRCLSFMEDQGYKGEPVARILLPLSD